MKITYFPDKPDIFPARGRVKVKVNTIYYMEI